MTTLQEAAMRDVLATARDALQDSIRWHNGDAWRNSEKESERNSWEDRRESLQEAANKIDDALRTTLAQQGEPVAGLNRSYTEQLINVLHENSDPVSIDAAEEFQRLLAAALAQKDDSLQAKYLKSELAHTLAQQGEQLPVCHGCGIPAGDVHMSTCKSGKWPSRVSNGDTAAPAPQAQEPIAKLFGTLPVYDTPAPQQVAQQGEPVAYMAKNKNSGTESLIRARLLEQIGRSDDHDYTPLYAGVAPAPQAQDWKKEPEYVPPLVKWAQEQSCPQPEICGSKECEFCRDTAAPAPQAQEQINCDCGRTHKKTAYGWACNEPAPQPAQGEPTGCACRWDADDNRVATCERHQGWLDVVHEWAERAKAAEAAMQFAARYNGVKC